MGIKIDDTLILINGCKKISPLLLMIYSRFNKCINLPLKLIRKAIKTFIATKEF